MSTEWISVKTRPLFTVDEKGNWECTEDGDRDFMAAVECDDGSWWIRHCVVEDKIGLCIVGENDNEPAPVELSDIDYFMHIDPPSPPKEAETEESLTHPPHADNETKEYLHADEITKQNTGIIASNGIVNGNYKNLEQ